MLGNIGCGCRRMMPKVYAGTCVAGGAKTLRPTVVRDAVYRWADHAGLQSEKERPHLLLPQRSEDVDIRLRRPADIFLPSFNGQILLQIARRAAARAGDDAAALYNELLQELSVLLRIHRARAILRRSAELAD